MNKTECRGLIVIYEWANRRQRSAFRQWVKRRVRLAKYTKEKAQFWNVETTEITLISHTMKLWELIIEKRIREIVELKNILFGFRIGMSTRCGLTKYFNIEVGVQQ